MINRSQQTLDIEEMLREGRSHLSIAKVVGITRQRVGQIAKRVTSCTQDIAMQEVQSNGVLTSESPMKSLTVQFTPAVFKALTEACSLINIAGDTKTTVEEYVEECVMVRLSDAGLLRQQKRK